MNRLAVSTAGSAWSRQQSQSNVAASTSAANLSASWISSSLADKARSIFGGGAEQKRLRSIRSVFPHEDSTQITNIADIYAEALGYFSPRSHCDSSKTTIAHLFLAQIRTGHFHYLQIALDDLSSFENQHSLAVIMTTCMNDIENLYDNYYLESGNTTLSTIAKESKTLISVLHFMIRITLQSDSACRTVLGAGILDILLRIYDIFPAFSKSALDTPDYWSPLLDACRSIILALSQSQENNGEIFSHPVCTIWPDCDPHPPAYSVEPPTAYHLLVTRCAAWRTVNSLCIRRRLYMILTGNLWQSNVHKIEDVEACADLVELTRSQFYDSEIVELAFLAMLKQILSAGSSAVHLVDAIAQIAHQDIIYIFSGVIQLWLECTRLQVQTQLTYGTNAGSDRTEKRPISHDMALPPDDNLYDREKYRLFQKTSNLDSALHNIIKFCAMAARRHRTIRFCMLDAGVLSLVITAFVNADFLAPSLVDLTLKKGKQMKVQSAGAGNRYNQDSSLLPSSISSDVIQAEASMLSVLMHSSAFRKTWHRQQFNDRRHLCSLLVHSLLGDFGETDDKYIWTRALFRKILA